MRYPRFDSRANDAMIDEISRRRCRPGQRWDPVNQVCRGHGIGVANEVPAEVTPIKNIPKIKGAE